MVFKDSVTSLVIHMCWKRLLQKLDTPFEHDFAVFRLTFDTFKNLHLAVAIFYDDGQRA